VSDGNADGCLDIVGTSEGSDVGVSDGCDDIVGGLDGAREGRCDGCSEIEGSVEGAFVGYCVRVEIVDFFDGRRDGRVKSLLPSSYVSWSNSAEVPEKLLYRSLASFHIAGEMSPELVDFSCGTITLLVASSAVTIMNGQSTRSNE